MLSRACAKHSRMGYGTKKLAKESKALVLIIFKLCYLTI